VPDLSSIYFLWPLMLWACTLVPALALVYSIKTRKRPPIVLGLGLLLLCIALARPQTVLMTPVRDATVMLVMDTSGSMRAKDLQPSRIEVAQKAAQQFIEEKPRSLRVGLVTVAGTAALAQAPTEDRDVLLKALDYLPLQYGSALGTGILVSLEALLPAAGIDAQKIINESDAAGGTKNQANSGQSLDDKKTAHNTASPSTGQGRQMDIVLMSDGQNNMGPELKQMADLAATHQVKIYTVGIGTAEGDVVRMQGRSMRVKLEDEALKKVSAITQGEYFKADSAQALKSIYDKLGHRLRFEKRAMSEITAYVSVLGLLLVLVSVARSFVRMGKII
jgi:Ca-activated chloride channel family protein